MTDLTIADVLAKLEKDLAWRGPGGNPMGHIVLTRREAELCAEMLKREPVVAEKESK